MKMLNKEVKMPILNQWNLPMRSKRMCSNGSIPMREKLKSRSLAKGLLSLMSLSVRSNNSTVCLCLKDVEAIQKLL